MCIWNWNHESESLKIKTMRAKAWNCHYSSKYCLEALNSDMADDENIESHQMELDSTHVSNLWLLMFLLTGIGIKHFKISQ